MRVVAGLCSTPDRMREREKERDKQRAKARGRDRERGRTIVRERQIS
jgi:hypothetical protein